MLCQSCVTCVTDSRPAQAVSFCVAEEVVTSRVSCAPGNQAEFSAEMLIHCTGLKHLDQPGVWLFPKLLVCLGCGFAQFSVPEKELALLGSCAPTSATSTTQQGVDEEALPIEWIL